MLCLQFLRMNLIARNLNSRILNPVLRPVRYVSAVKRAQKTHPLDPNLVLIYRFKYATHASVLNWAKCRLIIAQSVLVPVLGTSYFFHVISPEIFYGFLCAGCTVTFSFVVLGILTNNLIGIVYILNSDPNKVKISYIDFWGRRKDIIVSIDDIQSGTYLPSKITDYLYKTINIDSMKLTLKLNAAVGEIFDLTNFMNVFWND